MTRSFAQIEPAFASRYCSIAQRAQSVDSVCQPPCAAPIGSPSDRLPKNSCNSVHCGNRLESSPKAFDNSPRYGRQSHKRQPDESADKARSRPIVCWLFSRQMTTFHPIPMSATSAHQALFGAAFDSRAGARRLFFEPGANRITRHAEGASHPAQRRAFFVGMQNLCTLGFAIAKRLRIVMTATEAGFTQIALFAIASQAVAKQIFTAAMTAFNRDRNHRLRLTPLTLLSHYRTFFNSAAT